MIIVTGGAGFIGSNLIKYLNGKNIYDILLVDKIDSVYKFDNIYNLKFKKFIDMDELDYDTLPSNIEKVFHLGAITSTVCKDVKALFKQNYQSTVNWTNYCVLNNIKLVYTSSASVYGNTGNFEESATINPLNYYAKSKGLTENFINTLSNKVWVFRPFNVYGNGELHKLEQASPFTKFKEQLKTTKFIELFEGSDKITRDFICVDDVVNILANYTDTDPGTYNLGTGISYSFDYIARLFSSNIKIIKFPKDLKSSYQYYSKANTDKLRNNLIGDYKFITPSEYYDNIKRVNTI